MSYNHGKRRMLLAGHRAMQQVAAEYAWDDSADRRMDRDSVKTEEWVHRRTLTILQENGFPGFLVDADGELACASQGRRCDDEGGWLAWVVYNQAEVLEYLRFLEGWDDLRCSPEQRGAVWKERGHELGLELTGWAGRYGGPGQKFAHEPCVHVGRTRLLVTQDGGLDI